MDNLLEDQAHEEDDELSEEDTAATQRISQLWPGNNDFPTPAGASYRPLQEEISRPRS